MAEDQSDLSLGDAPANSMLKDFEGTLKSAIKQVIEKSRKDAAGGVLFERFNSSNKS